MEVLSQRFSVICKFGRPGGALVVVTEFPSRVWANGCVSGLCRRSNLAGLPAAIWLAVARI
jgi:hypothetical protein